MHRNFLTRFGLSCVRFAAAAVVLIAAVPALAQPPILPLFEMKLTFPKEITINLMPPVPKPLIVRVPAKASLKNNSGRAELLFASTPCDIHKWDVVDATGRVVDAEREVMCIEITQMYNLKPNETIQSDNIVALNGRAYAAGQTYTIRYKFWNFSDEQKFLVKHVF